jgi:hypothetical protein
MAEGILSQWPLALVCAVLALVSLVLYRQALRARRERFIRTYVFKVDHFDKLCQKHPGLDLKGCHMAARALRQFFLIHHKLPKQRIGMPSRVVDDLWHEFILDTREYQRFCRQAFGRFFHHTPSTAMHRGEDAAAELKLTWRHACMEENIGWRKPTRLPLLFAIDEKLRIKGAQRYSLRKPEESGAAAGHARSARAVAPRASGFPMGFGGPINLTHVFGCFGGGLTKGAASEESVGGLFGGSHDFSAFSSDGGGSGSDAGCSGGCAGGCGGD